MTITDLLLQWKAGDREALNQLIPVVRQRLYEIAEHQLQNEGNKVLQPTELLNEVYLRLTEYKHPNFRDRSHFFGAASSLVRRILVDVYRRHRAAKRDFTLEVRNVFEADAAVRNTVDLAELDDALEKLGRIDARQARIVELRYFVGFSIAETAQVLGISRATVKRDWEVAKAWLKRELEK